MIEERLGEVGVFAGEPGQRLLRVLILLVEHALGDVNAHMIDDERFRDCLARVKRWSISLVGQQLDSVSESAPDVRDRILDAYTRFVREMSGRTTVCCNGSIADEIAREFLARVSNDVAVRNRTFFVKQGAHRRISCMDAMRDALNHVSRTQSNELFDIVEDDDVLPSDSVSNCGARR